MCALDEGSGGMMQLTSSAEKFMPREYFWCLLIKFVAV